MGWGQTLTERWFLWVEGLGSQGRSWRTWDLSQTPGGWVGGRRARVSGLWEPPILWVLQTVISRPQSGRAVPGGVQWGWPGPGPGGQATPDPFQVWQEHACLETSLFSLFPILPLIFKLDV